MTASLMHSSASPTPTAASRRSSSRSSRTSQRKASKELALLAAVAREGARPSRLRFGGSSAEVGVTGLLIESAAVTATLFNTVESISASASTAACSCRKTAALVWPDQEDVCDVGGGGDDALMERLEELEECINELENDSDEVFRSLVQTRVTLLNIHTNIFKF